MEGAPPQVLCPAQILQNLSGWIEAPGKHGLAIRPRRPEEGVHIVRGRATAHPAEIIAGRPIRLGRVAFLLVVAVIELHRHLVEPSSAEDLRGIDVDRGHKAVLVGDPADFLCAALNDHRMDALGGEIVGELHGDLRVLFFASRADRNVIHMPEPLGDQPVGLHAPGVHVAELDVILVAKTGIPREEAARSAAAVLRKDCRAEVTALKLPVHHKTAEHSLAGGAKADDEGFKILRGPGGFVKEMIQKHI